MSEEQQVEAEQPQKKPRNQSITVKMTQECYFKLQLYAHQNNLSMSELAGDLLDVVLESKYNPVDLKPNPSHEDRIQYLETIVARLLAIPSVKKAVDPD
jgi:hypothetical protein